MSLRIRSRGKRRTSKSLTKVKQKRRGELERMQESIKELEAEMSRIKATLDEQTKEVEEAKRAASKAAKALEHAQKEISSRVGLFHLLRDFLRV
jgi:structural maintenance of chromosome 1